MASEFDLIARYFTRPCRTAVLGVGDDAALIRPTPGMELAISADMLVADRHFYADTDPESLGHKVLAVNLSDIAAMGAQPRWALLSMALPAADETWLAGFAKGLLDLAERHGVELVGGDTTRGPLNLSLTIVGEVEAGRALRRDAAHLGDDIWVSGELGGAALGLRHLQGKVTLTAAQRETCLARLHKPEPRLALGRHLLGLAHAAIDISDGLLADLGHILERSACGARLELISIPGAQALMAEHPEHALECCLAGGDDYELCFTADAARRNEIVALGALLDLGLSRIGTIVAEPGVVLIDANGQRVSQPPRCGYDHFT
jgi:thiamine-monophosphate kinase